MDEAPDSEPGSLRFLRVLVTTLTVVMIVGFIVLIGFLVTRFPGSRSVELPAEITLPDGASAIAFTQAPDWYAVVSDDDRIFVFDRTSGELINEIQVRP